MILDIFIWWLVAQLFGLAGLPLTLFFFRGLPDRGYAFSKTLGLLLSGYVAWLLAMLGLAPFGGGLVVICALAVGAGGLLLSHQRSAASSRPGIDVIAWLRERWRLVLGYEALFAAALVFLALLRSYNPEPWGTERPMDYALFNAIRRSTSFPPHDPWLAGYSINYYYFGYFLMACMALVSNLEQAVAYNLSLALIFALSALGVAGIVLNLIGLTDPRPETKDPRPENYKHRSGILVLSSWFAVLFAVLLVLVVGNQGGILQIITGTDMAVALEGRDMGRAVVNGLGPRAPLYLEHEFKGDYFDGTRIITPTSALDAARNFNWWNPTRAVWDSYPNPDDPSVPVRHYAITEFPFFSFWLGDMHPHVMALPFGLLALALALQTLARPAAPTFAIGRRGWLDLALTGIVLGSLYVINSWDFPTYMLLFLGALLLLYVRLGAESAKPDSPGRDAGISKLGRVWWRHYATQALPALLAAGILFAPFHLTFHSLVGGREPLVKLPILSTITRTLGFVTWSKTPLYSFTIIFGLLLLPSIAYVFAQGRQAQGGTLPREDGQTLEPAELAATQPATAWSEERLAFAAIPSRSFSWSARQYLPWATLAALALGLLIGFPLLALLPLAIYAAILALEHAGRPAAAFTLWAFTLGCLICFGTELIYIRDVFESRLNTIFKFYYQAWLIWGVLAGYALWWLFARRWATDDGRSTAAGRKRFIVYRLSSIVLGALFVALLAGALVYPWLTAGKSFREGQRVGLNGKTPLEQTPGGAAAIEWLRTNVPGDSVILEAVGGAYNTEGFGGVSASTGLATVLGWPGHEGQWRGGDPAANAQIGPRENDVRTIYSTTDVAQARDLLAKYGVDYIYVGFLERQTYPAAGLAKLPQLADRVFQENDVAIYRVKP